MTLLIDGDSCPKLALEAILSLRKNHNIPLEIVADRLLPSWCAEFLTLVEKGSGKTDSLILERAQKNDLVLTRDLYLARELIKRGSAVMNDRGILWDSIRLERRIEDSRIMQAMRAGGMVQHQSARYTAADARMLYDSLVDFFIFDYPEY